MNQNVTEVYFPYAVERKNIPAMMNEFQTTFRVAILLQLYLLRIKLLPFVRRLI